MRSVPFRHLLWPVRVPRPGIASLQSGAGDLFRVCGFFFLPLAIQRRLDDDVS